MRRGGVEVGTSTEVRVVRVGRLKERICNGTRTMVPFFSPDAASNLLCSAVTTISCRPDWPALSPAPSGPVEPPGPKLRGPMPVPGARARGVFA